MGLVLGVDPAAKGAAAVITEAGQFVSACPASIENGVLSDDVFRWLDHLPLVEACALEEPILRIGEAVAVMRIRSVSISAGQWLGMLAVAGIRHVRRVRPQSWQARVLGKFPRGESKAASMRWARMAHGKAVEMLLREHGDGIADALAIAEWARLELAAERQRDRALLAEARR